VRVVTELAKPTNVVDWVRAATAGTADDVIRTALDAARTARARNMYGLRFS
jgi:hypothetical protein